VTLRRCPCGTGLAFAECCGPLHDGTAAARAYAGEANAAVITLGTALGVGFPSRYDRLRPLEPGFSVSSLPPPPD